MNNTYPKEFLNHKIFINKENISKDISFQLYKLLILCKLIENNINNLLVQTKYKKYLTRSEFPGMKIYKDLLFFDYITKHLKSKYHINYEEFCVEWSKFQTSEYIFKIEDIEKKYSINLDIYKGDFDIFSFCMDSDYFTKLMVDEKTSNKIIYQFAKFKGFKFLD